MKAEGKEGTLPSPLPGTSPRWGEVERSEGEGAQVYPEWA